MNPHEKRESALITTIMANTRRKKRPGKGTREYADHFLSLWLEDPQLKRRLRAVAAGDDRTMNNFINHKFVPLLEEAINSKWRDLEKKGRERLVKEGVLEPTEG